MGLNKKARKEQLERRQRAVEHRSRAILKVFKASPDIEKGASWFTNFFNCNKYDPQEVDFHRSALKLLVSQGFLVKTQKVYNGKIGNSYRLAPSELI